MVERRLACAVGAHILSPGFDSRRGEPGGSPPPPPILLAPFYAIFERFATFLCSGSLFRKQIIRLGRRGLSSVSVSPRSVRFRISPVPELNLVRFPVNPVFLFIKARLPDSGPVSVSRSIQ